MASPTPGPFAVDPHDPHRVIGPEGVTVAICGPGGVYGPRSYVINSEEAAANARMVAAACNAARCGEIASTAPGLIADAESICPICGQMSILRQGPGGFCQLACEQLQASADKRIPAHIFKTEWCNNMSEARRQWGAACELAGGAR